MAQISCDEALVLLSAQLDGALTAQERSALDLHLAACPACSALLSDFEEIHAELGQGKTVPPPPDLKDGIMAAVRAERVIPFPGTARTRPHWRAWSSVAAMLTLVLLGAGMFRFLNAPTDAAPAPMEMAAPAAAGGRGAGGGEATSPAVERAPRYRGPDPECTPVSAPANAPPAPSPAPEPSANALPASIAAPKPPTPAQTPAPHTTGRDGGLANTQQTPPPESTPAAGPAPLLSASRQELPTRFCGILTLPVSLAPALDAYPSEPRDGATRYYLPAADFQALAEQSAALEGAALILEGETLSPDAEYGAVDVTA